MCRHLAPCDSQPVMLALEGTDWANEGFYIIWVSGLRKNAPVAVESQRAKKHGWAKP